MKKVILWIASGVFFASITALLAGSLFTPAVIVCLIFWLGMLAPVLS